MPDIKKAQDAKTAARLDRMIQTSAYGIVSRRDRIVRSVADGCTIEAAQVSDDAAKAKAEKEYEYMNRGFNTPWGNDKHPKTSAANALKERLTKPFAKIEYRLHRPDGDYFNALSKTEYDLASSLYK